MIKLVNVSKKFGNRVVLDSIDLEIPDHSIIGIYGKSGIGKSTLAKLICGLLPLDTGTIYLDDHVLFQEGHPYNRKDGLKIQMVYQQPFATLDPSQVIKKGIEELLTYYKVVPKNEMENYITKLVKNVELEKDILNHLPYQISGGEAQRIAILKSLLFKPKLLILDEATSMLDVSTQANILFEIKKKIEESKSSILFISHDEELINQYCEIVYKLENGKLIRRKN